MCQKYQYEVLRNLPSKRIQCDEIWSFCYAKEKNVPEDKKGQFGYRDLYTWTAICADSKLVPSWYVGRRHYRSAKYFIDDLAGRLAHRVQLTTDSHKAYLQAVKDSFGSEIDYAQLIKLYGNEVESEKRYSPRRMHRSNQASNTGQSRYVKACLYKLCRAPESYNADEHETLHQSLLMDSQGNYKILRLQYLCTSCTIILLAFIKPCELLQQWKLGLQIMYGLLKELFLSLIQNESLPDVPA